MELLNTCQNTVPSRSGAGRYAEIVREKAAWRRDIQHAAELTDAAYAEDRAGRYRAIDRLNHSSIHAPCPVIEDVWARLANGTNPAPPPSLLVRTDSVGVLHEGAAILLIGPGGVGKTMLAQQAAFTTPMAGRRVAWVDLDNMGLDQLVARLAILGLDETKVTSHTLAYLDSSRFDDVTRLWTSIEAVDAELVIVDSLIGLLALAGVDSENDNLAVRGVLQGTRDVVNRRRETSLIVIDHTGHEGGRARGASSKHQWADQVVEVSSPDPIGVGRVGRLRLSSRKDRRGYWTDGVPMAEIEVDATSPMSGLLSHLGNAIVMTSRGPVSNTAADPTHMEVIMDLLRKEAAHGGGEVAWAVLKEIPPLSKIHRSQQASAREALVEEGRIVQRTGPRGSIWISPEGAA